MKIGAMYSHLNGYEWMLVHRPDLWEEIKDVIANVNADNFKNKVSKERNMVGKLLFSPTALNDYLKHEFAEKGRGEKRTSYWVTDDYGLIMKTMRMSESEQKQAIINNGKVPIRSYNQTDFEKDRVAIEVQFGKYSFIAYDLLRVVHYGIRLILTLLMFRLNRNLLRYGMVVRAVILAKILVLNPGNVFP